LLPDDFDDRFYQTPRRTSRRRRSYVWSGRFASPHARRRSSFSLPKVFLGFETRFRDGSRAIHRERRLHTVILEPDHPRVSLVWHTALPCHFKVQKLERTVVRLKAQLGGTESIQESDELDPA
jgi:hypothetical protein